MKTAVLSRIAFLALVLTGNLAIAQDNTLTPDKKTSETTPPDGIIQKVHNRILLVPFDPKLYMSAIDQNIAQKTGLTHAQIKARMRHGLNVNMFASSDPLMKTVSMLDSEDPEVQKDIAYIYNSIGYKYEVMPAESVEEEAAPEKGVAKITGKLTRLVENDRANRDAPINGDVVEAEPERYMKTTIINPNLLSYLSTRYEADVFLFINQLDISSEIGEGGYAYAQHKNKRRMKVHYTIYDVKGNEIYGGASVVYFPSNVNDLNGIINGYFPTVTNTIATHLPKKDQTTAEVKLQTEQEKKAEEQRKAILKN